MIPWLLCLVLGLGGGPQPLHFEKLEPGVYQLRTMDFGNGEFTSEDVMLSKTSETIRVTTKNAQLVGIVKNDRVQFMMLGHIDSWSGAIEQNKVSGHVLNSLGKVKNFILEKK